MKIVTHSDEVQLTYDTDKIESLLGRRSKSNTKDLSAFMIRYAARRELPYGIWTCKDGSQVIFNREYQPIIHIKDGVNTYDNKNRWVDNIASVIYFYNDYTSPMNVLTKHLGQSSKQTKECKKSLFICIDVLRQYTPKESSSVNSEHSIVQM